jgi:hypothetical protein
MYRIVLCSEIIKKISIIIIIRYRIIIASMFSFN